MATATPVCLSSRELRGTAITHGNEVMTITAVAVSSAVTTLVADEALMTAA